MLDAQDRAARDPRELTVIWGRHQPTMHEYNSRWSLQDGPRNSALRSICPFLPMIDGRQVFVAGRLYHNVARDVVYCVPEHETLDPPNETQSDPFFITQYDEAERYERQWVEGMSYPMTADEREALRLSMIGGGLNEHWLKLAKVRTILVNDIYVEGWLFYYEAKFELEDNRIHTSYPRFRDSQDRRTASLQDITTERAPCTCNECAGSRREDDGYELEEIYDED